MCKFIVIFVGLLSFHCLGADSENNFQRTNNETDSFEVLFKKYSSNNVSVKLIPMAHCASLGFFERVESELDGKIAIYELMGADLTAKKDIFELNAATRRMTETLGPLYLKAYQAAKILNDPFAAMAKKYDLKYQLEYLSYNKAKELIWADVEDPVFHDTIIELRRSLADIETFRQDNFIAPAKILITKKIIEDSDDENELILNFAKFLQLKAEQYINDLPPTLREFIDLRSKQDKEMLRSQDKLYQDMIFKRNQIVFEKIKLLLCRSDKKIDAIIIYGAAHMPMIETFLLELGFSPNDQEWVEVLSLK